MSLLILVLGLRALMSLPVRQYPQTQNAVVTVITAYYGADAQTVAGFITQPLERDRAGAGHRLPVVDQLAGVSTIIATLRLNYDANRALTEIKTQVNSVRNQLPPEAQQPVLTVQVGETIDAMYMGFFSDSCPRTTTSPTTWLRVVKPKLDSVEGVQTAEILGARQFALRAWLDPRRMAAYGVTASDVRAALASNNYLAALGSTKGQMVSVDLTAGTEPALGRRVQAPRRSSRRTARSCASRTSPT